MEPFDIPMKCTPGHTMCISPHRFWVMGAFWCTPDAQCAASAPRPRHPQLDTAHHASEHRNGRQQKPEPDPHHGFRLRFRRGRASVPNDTQFRTAPSMRISPGPESGTTRARISGTARPRTGPGASTRHPPTRHVRHVRYVLDSATTSSGIRPRDTHIMHDTHHARVGQRHHVRRASAHATRHGRICVTQRPWAGRRPWTART